VNNGATCNLRKCLKFIPLNCITWALTKQKKPR